MDTTQFDLIESLTAQLDRKRTIAEEAITLLLMLESTNYSQEKCLLDWLEFKVKNAELLEIIKEKMEPKPTIS
jgi:hypothetical protein